MSESTPFKLDYDSQDDADNSRLSHDTAVQQHKKYAAKHDAHQTEARYSTRLRDVSLLISIIGNICFSIALLVVVLPSLRRSDSNATLSDNALHAPSRNPLGELPRPIKPLLACSQLNSSCPDLVIPGVEDNVWMPVRFNWDYYAASVDGMDQVDRNWDAINPDVGVVAVPHEELTRWGVTKLKSLPSNSSMGFHFMQGYHSLHCLVS